MEKLEIELVKRKIIPGVILMNVMLIFFILVSIKLNSIASFLNIEKGILIPGVVIGILFSILFIILILKKTFNTKPGLLINEEGITNNTTMISTEKINWNEINKISQQMIGIHNYILIEIKDPKSYIDRESNPIKKWFMKVNTDKYKTPFMIPPKVLKIDSEKLFDLLTNKITN